MDCGPSHLPEKTSAGVGTFSPRYLSAGARLPRFHRADPSTSLDKRTFQGLLIVKRNVYITENLICQMCYPRLLKNKFYGKKTLIFLPYMVVFDKKTKKYLENPTFLTPSHL